MTGGTVHEVGALPDGSGFATMSFPLPKDHWIYEKAADGFRAPPPMPFIMGTDDPRREKWAQAIRAAGKYAVRASTMGGKEMDFDPDAMLQNLIVGMLGYWTPNGYSSDTFDNPDQPVTPVA